MKDSPSEKRKAMYSNGNWKKTIVRLHAESKVERLDPPSPPPRATGGLDQLNSVLSRSMLHQEQNRSNALDESWSGTISPSSRDSMDIDYKPHPDDILCPIQKGEEDILLDLRIDRARRRSNPEPETMDWKPSILKQEDQSHRQEIFTSQTNTQAQLTNKFLNERSFNRSTQIFKKDEEFPHISSLQYINNYLPMRNVNVSLVPASQLRSISSNDPFSSSLQSKERNLCITLPERRLLCESSPVEDSTIMRYSQLVDTSTRYSETRNQGLASHNLEPMDELSRPSLQDCDESNDTSHHSSSVASQSNEYPENADDPQCSGDTETVSSIGSEPTKRIKKKENKDLKCIREAGIDEFLTLEEIINLPMDEFNQKLENEKMTDLQRTTARDVRRRGKNKSAAQSCRKKKADQMNKNEKKLQIIQEKRRKEDEKDQKLQLLLDFVSAYSNKLTILHKQKFGLKEEPSSVPCSVPSSSPVKSTFPVNRTLQNTSTVISTNLSTSPIKRNSPPTSSFSHLTSSKAQLPSHLEENSTFLENDRISFIPPSSKRAKETASPPVDMYTDRLQPYQTSRPGASFSLLGPREQPRQTSGPRGREQNSQIRHFLSYPGLTVNKNEISLFKVYD